jgi:hypothetical protein
MCMSALTARHIENARSRRQAQHVDEPSCFFPIALEREERLVLE